jgi:hypothetical protein
MEEFKNIEGYPGYEVSNYGNVRSSKRKKQIILKPSIGMKGYYYVYICNVDKKYKHHYIHRLVASTFIRSINKDEQVDHINADKIDNNLTNLQIVDNRINQLRNRRGKCLPGVTKSYNKFFAKINMNKKTVYLEGFKSEEEAHEAYKNKLKEYGINIAFDKDMAYMLDNNTI